MNIRVGYQIPYSQAKIDNTHLNRLKRRLAANHYDYEQEMDDLNFIFDEASEAQKDLVIIVY